MNTKKCKAKLYTYKIYKGDYLIEWDIVINENDYIYILSESYELKYQHLEQGSLKNIGDGLNVDLSEYSCELSEVIVEY